MLFFAVIHKRNGMKLINKTIEYKLDSSSKIKFTFFILKIFKSFYDNYQFCQKSENDANSRGRGVVFLASLWPSAYENRHLIHR